MKTHICLGMEVRVKNGMNIWGREWRTCTMREMTFGDTIKSSSFCIKHKLLIQFKKISFVFFCGWGGRESGGKRRVGTCLSNTTLHVNWEHHFLPWGYLAILLSYSWFCLSLILLFFIKDKFLEEFYIRLWTSSPKANIVIILIRSILHTCTHLNKVSIDSGINLWERKIMEGMASQRRSYYELTLVYVTQQSVISSAWESNHGKQEWSALPSSL